MLSDFLIIALTCLILTIFLLGVSAVAYYQTRRNRAIAARLAEITAQGAPPLLTLNTPLLRGVAASINGRRIGLNKSVLVLTPERFMLFGRTPALPEQVSFAPDRLRWFGRPRKYGNGYNAIWLHVETDHGWQIIRLRLYRDAMQQLVRALKAFAAPELVEAYRRRRPYVHDGPVRAQPAVQDIHGAWTLAAPVSLYLMPRFLVILNRQTVLRKIPLEAVQQVGALRRLDAPHARGLVRFRAEEESFAFAVDRHETFAAALAEAAKRTLEAPIERKQKAKDDAYPEIEDQLLSDETPPKRLSR
ncbi:MAG: hypothetical protein HZC41_23280 [Chloroflexi bacterium]|nr:hypothetical protein [Chloroflexota bacterium]